MYRMLPTSELLLKVNNASTPDFRHDDESVFIAPISDKFRTSRELAIGGKQSLQAKSKRIVFIGDHYPTKQL
jgi:hypothetical protein